jgi:uncharacterized protein YukE
MAEKFRLDPEALERTKNALAGASEQFSQALAQLGGVLNDHEGCWGDDQIGVAFKKKYQQPAKDARTYAGNANESVANIPPMLDEVAQALQGLDQDSAKRIDHLLGEQLDAPSE